jgi:hypothetical protein
VLVVVPMGTVARLDKGAYLTTPAGRSRPHLFSFGRVAENTGQTSPISVAATPTFGSRLPISLH